MQDKNLIFLVAMISCKLCAAFLYLLPKKEFEGFTYLVMIYLASAQKLAQVPSGETLVVDRFQSASCLFRIGDTWIET